MNKFQHGDIVYWCHSEGNGLYKVNWGRVDERYSGVVSVDYLALPENRFVNGVPIDEFESEAEFHHLPKRWTYQTKLFELTEGNYDFDPSRIRIDDPKGIQEAYAQGHLVKKSTLFHGMIETEVKDGGYRIVKKYSGYSLPVNCVSLTIDRLYESYAAAQEEVDAKIAEFKRQAELSDEDWSLEQIGHAVQRWQSFHSATDDAAQAYRDWFADLNNVEDVVVRCVGGELQWKYDRDRKWKTVEL